MCDLLSEGGTGLWAAVKMMSANKIMRAKENYVVSFFHPSPDPSGVSLIYNFFLRGNGGLGTDLFCAETSIRTRGNGLNLCRGTFRLNWGPELSRFRKRLFSKRGSGTGIASLG